MSVIRYTAAAAVRRRTSTTPAADCRGTAAKPASRRRPSQGGAAAVDAVVGGSRDGDVPRCARAGLFWRCHGPRNSRLPHTRPLRGRDRRAARQPNLLPAGRRTTRAVISRDAGEAAGRRARRADRGAAAGDQPPVRHAASRPRPATRGPRARWSRPSTPSSGSARWASAGMPRRRRWSSNCSRSPRPSSTRRWCSTTPRTGPTPCACSSRPSRRGSSRPRSNRVISAGRPPCPLCDEPLDPEGHICVRTNGYRAELRPREPDVDPT